MTLHEILSRDREIERLVEENERLKDRVEDLLTSRDEDDDTIEALRRETRDALASITSIKAYCDYLDRRRRLLGLRDLDAADVIEDILTSLECVPL